MGGKRSRDKGGRAERHVKKSLSEWWGEDFHRTPQSGAFSTTTGGASNVAGDVSTHDASFPFCVEVKNQEGWHLEQLFTALKCDLIQWWKQAKEQTPEGQIPLLIFTRNRQPYFFVMPNYSDVTIEAWTVWIGDDRVLLGRFEDFLDTCPSTWEQLDTDWEHNLL